MISPIGCDGNIYYWRILLKVTDPAGLFRQDEVDLYPNCAGGNTPPTISDTPNQTIAHDTSTGPLSFTVGDTETAATNLVMTGASSNPALAPTGNLVFGGSGATRTVTVTPVPGQSGTATITLTVNDGQFSASDTFLLTVTGAANTAPTLSNIADLSTNEDTATSAIGFTVGDAETTAGSLTVTGASSNPTLVPAGNVVFGGSGAARTVTVTPAANQSGTATITVTVSDGALTASDTFLLTVTPVNDAPTISGLVTQTSVENATITLPLVASDPDGDSVELQRDRVTGRPQSQCVDRRDRRYADLHERGHLSRDRHRVRRRGVEQHELHLDGDRREPRAGADGRGRSDQRRARDDHAAARGKRSRRQHADLQRDGAARRPDDSPDDGRDQRDAQLRERRDASGDGDGHRHRVGDRQHDLHLDGDRREPRAGADGRGGSDERGKCGDHAGGGRERSRTATA